MISVSCFEICNDTWCSQTIHLYLYRFVLALCSFRSTTERRRRKRKVKTSCIIQKEAAQHLFVYCSTSVHIFRHKLTVLQRLPCNFTRSSFHPNPVFVIWKCQPYSRRLGLTSNQLTWMLKKGKSPLWQYRWNKWLFPSNIHSSFLAPKHNPLACLKALQARLFPSTSQTTNP